MLIYFLIFVVVILVGFHIYLHGSRSGKLVDKIPGIEQWPILGNAADFLQGATVTFYRARYMANRLKKSYRLWVIQKSVINLIEPDDIEMLLTSSKHISKSMFYDFLKPWFNDGLLTSTGSKWQMRRKILTPAFYFNILKQFCSIFVEQSNDLVEQLKSEVGKPETAIQPYIARAALHSICETAMGTNLDTMKESAYKYISAIYTFGEYLVYRFIRVWLHPAFFYNLSSVGRKQRKVVKTLHSFTNNVINERRKDRNASGDQFEGMIEGAGTKKRMAMLDLLLTAESENKIDANGIREEVDTFMFEGHDTTTVAMTFCLMCLANNPEIQELAFKEINEILGDSDNDPTIDELNNMNYLERCIKEALRLYPSVPFISRELKEDLHLKKYIVPAGSIVNVHIFDVHRDEKHFPNPSKFDPDRFLPENTVNRHTFAYIPFSAGPRNCIGQKFAILEEKAIISAVLRKYKLEPITRPDDVIFTADLVLRSLNAIKVKFVLRK